VHGQVYTSGNIYIYIYLYVYTHIYSGCYIHIMNIYSDFISRIWTYILGRGNLGTNVANGSIRILTLDEELLLGDFVFRHIFWNLVNQFNVI
jgi:hypothetical protein